MPQGLSLSASLLLALAAFIALGSQRIFALSLWRSVLSAFSCLAVMRFASSRPSSQCWPRSRTPSRWASPESWAPPVQVVAPFLLTLARLWLLQLPAAPAVPAAAPSPSHEVAASLLRSASLRAASPRTRTRSRSPAPLPKRAPRAPRRSSSVASGLRGSVALAESGLVTGLATKSCPPVPPPQLRLSRVSLALSTLPLQGRSLPPTFLDPLHPPIRPPRPLVPRSPRPTLMTSGTRSLTHTASRHLLVAPRPPSPSRPTPLELVGVLATSVAVGSAKPPSAPCGGTFDASPSAALRASDRRGFAGGFALGTCMLSRVMSSCWSLRSSSAASGYGSSLWRHWRWRWCGNQFGFSGN